MKNWMIAVGAVFALAVVLFLSDRTVKSPAGVDLIRTPDQYLEANNKALQFAKPPFVKADNFEKLTDADLNNVREGLKYFEAMRVYQPLRITCNFGAGKCFQILGEKERAAERFEQAVYNRSYDPERDRADIKATGIEAMAELSEVSLDLAAEEIANSNSLSQANDQKGADMAKQRAKVYYDKAFTNANQAVEAVPTAYRYLVDRANVYLALKNEDLAKKDIAKAKALAPNDPKVKMAVSMVGL